MGEFDLKFDLNTNKWSEDSFDGTNNKISVTNTSSCDVELTYGLRIYKDFEALFDSGFRLTNSSSNGEITSGVEEYCQAIVSDEVGVYGESETMLLEKEGSSEAYLTVSNPDYADLYQAGGFGHKPIGDITVTLEKPEGE